jgi:hypothetical protein
MPQGHGAMTSKIQPPVYVRIAGGLILGLGLVVHAEVHVVGAHSGVPWVAVAGAVVVVGGGGLLLGQRWAWPILVVTAIPWFFVAYVFLLPSSQTDPLRLDHQYGVVFIVVGLLQLVAAMTRATREWLVGRELLF